MRAEVYKEVGIAVSALGYEVYPPVEKVGATDLRAFDVESESGSILHPSDVVNAVHDSLPGSHNVHPVLRTLHSITFEDFDVV